MISAVIPTLGGAARLARNLPSVVASLREAGDSEVVVVNDGGPPLGELPEAVRVIRRQETGGYGVAVGDGVREARGQYLLILNDDVRLEHDCVGRLMKCFPDSTLFAVVPAIRSPLSRCDDEGGKRGVWRAGFIEIEDVAASDTQPALYPVGCCVLCRREEFLRLGGFADVYAPFFFEDVELGFRAWRRGLEVRHVPEAIAHHEGSATLGERHSKEYRAEISFRNRVLFHLRNVEDPALRAENVGALLATALLEPEQPRLRGLASALERYAGLTAGGADGLSTEEILRRSSGAPASGDGEP